MSAHEHSITIAFYFMLTSAAVALITALFGWNMPTGEQALVLIFTASQGASDSCSSAFPIASARPSALAPFDYAAMIWAVVLGYFLFGELPAPQVWLGRHYRDRGRAADLMARATARTRSALSPPAL